MTGITVLKLGGELLETPEQLQQVARTISDARGHTPRLMIVHGGGRAVDSMLHRVRIVPQQVDGIRVTDPDTLEIVVAVLAGAINTRLVAALNASGTPAVGLTGADAQLLSVRPAAPVTTREGRSLSLGRVGEPVAHGADTDADLAIHLIETGYVPVIASIGADRSGGLLNVNADTFAAALAINVGADRLVIAGTTAGVLDRSGETIPAISVSDADALIADGSASGGMIAKLRACRQAADQGVGAVVIADGATLADTLAGRGAGRGTAIRPVLRTPTDSAREGVEVPA